MNDLAHSIYDWIYRDLSLRTAGLIAGIVLIVAHAYALFNFAPARAWLKEAPRNKSLGIAILTVDLVWSLILMSSMDLGEFWKVRKIALVLLPVVYALMIVYVDEFLTARALGILLLLAACPLLDAAFLQLPATRVLLPLLAYVWIVAGMFWVGMPYLLRDQLGWVLASEARWKKLALGGLAYGAAIIVCALAFWGSAA